MKIDPHPYRKLEKRILIHCIDKTLNNIHKKILKNSIKTSKRLKGGFTEVSMYEHVDYKNFIQYTNNFIKNRFKDIIEYKFILAMNKRYCNKIRLSIDYSKVNPEDIETYLRILTHE